MHPNQFHEQPLLFPDSNSDAINWLYGTEGEFDGVWTVGNFLTTLAVLFGCNPIVFVGMDLCYEDMKKYAYLESTVPNGLVQAMNQEGQTVWTQRDWLMAALWTEEMAKKHSERLFINATEGGLGFRSPVACETLLTVMQGRKTLDLRLDLRSQVREEIGKLPLYVPPAERWTQWDASLQRCSQPGIELEEEVVYQKLLVPLWHVWKPIFERELDIDVHPLSRSEKLRLHQTLFFQQVVQEHA